jgi:hypothetical protein
VNKSLALFGIGSVLTSIFAYQAVNPKPVSAAYPSVASLASQCVATPGNYYILQAIPRGGGLQYVKCYSSTNILISQKVGQP